MITDKTKELMTEAGFVLDKLGHVDWASNYEEEMEKFVELVLVHYTEQFLEAVNLFTDTPLKKWSNYD